MNSTIHQWPTDPPIDCFDAEPVGNTLEGRPIYCGVASCTVNGLTFRRVATSQATQQHATQGAANRVRADYRQHLRDLGLVR
jgi:hypothetical protein